MRRLCVPVAISSLVAATFATSAQSATINYSGKITSSTGFSLVIPGTFAPSFNPLNYTCAYGDGICNLDPNAYNRAVADGVFFPAGAGTFTTNGGLFSGQGTTNALEGTPIWLFAFDGGLKTSMFQALASSSNLNWRVPAQPSGTTAILATEANVFELGGSHPTGIQTSVIPFPEAGAIWIALLGVVGCLVYLRSCNRRRFRPDVVTW